MKEIVVKGSDRPALVDDESFDIAARFTWRMSRSNNGRRTQYVVSDVREGRKVRKILLHRLVLGNVPSIIDHRDRDTLNNQRSNLRVATQSQNQANCPGRQRSSSRFRGVSWDGARKKWRAKVQFDGQDIKIGRFDTEEEAARAYDVKARELWGEFAYQNLTPRS